MDDWIGKKRSRNTQSVAENKDSPAGLQDNAVHAASSQLIPTDILSSMCVKLPSSFRFFSFSFYDDGLSFSLSYSSQFNELLFFILYLSSLFFLPFFFLIFSLLFFLSYFLMYLFFVVLLSFSLSLFYLFSVTSFSCLFSYFCFLSSSILWLKKNPIIEVARSKYLIWLLFSLRITGEHRRWREI